MFIQSDNIVFYRSLERLSVQRIVTGEHLIQSGIDERILAEIEFDDLEQLSESLKNFSLVFEFDVNDQ